MTIVTAKFCSVPHLGALVSELDALAGRMTGPEITKILGSSSLLIDDVMPFITPSSAAYSRQRVARTEAYEILVITWLPGQATGAHDHAGSVSAFKILSGTAQETLFTQAADSLVDPIGTREMHK